MIASRTTPTACWDAECGRDVEIDADFRVCKVFFLLLQIKNVLPSLSMRQTICVFMRAKDVPKGSAPTMRMTRNKGERLRSEPLSHPGTDNYFRPPRAAVSVKCVLSTRISSDPRTSAALGVFRPGDTRCKGGLSLYTYPIERKQK